MTTAAPLVKDCRRRLEMDLDIGNAGRVKRRRDIAPADLDRGPHASFEVGARSRSGRVAGENHAATTKASAGVERLEHGFGRPARHVGAERQIELEVSGVRQAALQMRGKAVARDDIEADAGQQHHASRLGFGVARGEGLEDVDFPGDVEVMRAIAQTGVRHRSRGRRKRPGGAEHDGDILESRVNAGRVGKIERPGGEAERPGHAFDLLETASGQDRARACTARRLGDQLAGVAGRPVDQDGSGHGDWPFAA